MWSGALIFMWLNRRQRRARSRLRSYGHSLMVGPACRRGAAARCARRAVPEAAATRGGGGHGLRRRYADRSAHARADGRCAPVRQPLGGGGQLPGGSAGLHHRRHPDPPLSRPAAQARGARRAERPRHRRRLPDRQHSRGHRHRHRCRRGGHGEPGAARCGVLVELPGGTSKRRAHEGSRPRRRLYPGHPQTAMPELQVGEEHARDIVAYLYTLR